MINKCQRKGRFWKISSSEKKVKVSFTGGSYITDHFYMKTLRSCEPGLGSITETQL